MDKWDVRSRLNQLESLNQVIAILFRAVIVVWDYFAEELINQLLFSIFGLVDQELLDISVFGFEYLASRACHSVA